MSTSATSIQVPYLPTSRQFPEEAKELNGVLSKSYVEIAQAMNRRTIGAFNTFQVVTGDQYYSTTNNNVHNPIQFRQAYRKVFPFGAIAQGATLTIQHAITGIVQTVHLYGNCITDVSVDATGKYKPIPYVSLTLNRQIQLFMNDTIITIANGAGADNILSGTIIVEYLLN